MKKVLKQTIRALAACGAIALTAAMTLTACSSDSNEPLNPDFPADGKTPITVTNLQVAGGSEAPAAQTRVQHLAANPSAPQGGISPQLRGEVAAQSRAASNSSPQLRGGAGSPAEGLAARCCTQVYDAAGEPGSTAAGEPGSGTLPPPTRAEWTNEYDPFYTGDLLTVSIDADGNAATTGDISRATYTYQPDGTWTATPQSGEVALYKEDLATDAGGNITATFTAAKGTKALATDQSTLDKYRAADHIAGALMLDATGTQLGNSTTTGETELTHSHVDVVITITPKSADGHWEGVDFIAHMQTATVQFLTTAEPGSGASPAPVKPYLATITPQAATYRAVMPVDRLPAAGSAIITIAAEGALPLTGTYTLDAAGEPGSGDSPAPAPAAGSRLAITLDYDNKRTLTTTSVTVTPWKKGPDYTAEYGLYDMVIRNANDLYAFARLVNEKKFTDLTAIQVADITLPAAAESPETSNWTPIGSNGTNDANTRFAGIYNGNGYAIKGLKINATTADNFQGLFGYTAATAVISGVHLEEVNVTGGMYTGGLVGINGGTVTACYVTGTVTGKDVSTGGLVGGNMYGTITACYATGKVTGTGNITGGLVGNNWKTITACYATSDVTSEGNATGGLVGQNLSTITACYATGKVTGTTNTGALVGDNLGTITYCHANIGNGNPDNLVGNLAGNGNPSDGNSTTPKAAGATVRDAWDGKVKSTDANKVTITVDGKIYTGNGIWQAKATEPKLSWQP